jgi:hypothetical protein
MPEQFSEEKMVRLIHRAQRMYRLYVDSDYGSVSARMWMQASKLVSTYVRITTWTEEENGK